MEHPLLQAPKTDFAPRQRVSSAYQPLHTFALPLASNRKFTTQFADLYFARLAQLKRHVEAVAEAAWSDFELDDNKASRVERVLDVRQGQLCWVVGTVFMDMPLKPNILDDLSKEAWIVSPPPREKYQSDESGQGQIILEDESGRLQIVGQSLSRFMLCTGCIIAVLGTENKDGAFSVVDVKFAGLPPQPERTVHNSSKIAIVSGLEMGSPEANLAVDLLAEYLIGDLGDDSEQPKISRLIITGNSLADSSPIAGRDGEVGDSQSRTAAETARFNASPLTILDNFLSSLLPTIPVTLIPGATDPVGVALPQQPLHAAFFPASRSYMKHPTDDSDDPSWFDSVTNPWDGEVDGLRVLATGGQPVNDMFKYVEGDDRLAMIESFLKWRNVAPTAPDTLSCYPFQDKDPFLIKSCPHVFIVGDQPRLETSIVEDEIGDQKVRIIAVPSFRKTGMFAILDTETLELEPVTIMVE